MYDTKNIERTNKFIKNFSRILLIPSLKKWFRNKYYIKEKKVETDYQKLHRIYKVGDYTYTGKDTIIKNLDTTIGKFCSIASNVNIGVSQAPTNWLTTHLCTYDKKAGIDLSLNIADERICHWDFNTELLKPIHIGNDVWIGKNAIIMDGVNIADGAIIGAGAVVTHDVPPYAIVGGVPAKIIRYRFSSEIIEKLLDLKWWDYPKEFIENELPFNDIEKCIEILEKNQSLKQPKQ